MTDDIRYAAAAIIDAVKSNGDRSSGSLNRLTATAARALAHAAYEIGLDARAMKHTAGRQALCALCARVEAYPTPIPWFVFGPLPFQADTWASAGKIAAGHFTEIVHDGKWRGIEPYPLTDEERDAIDG